MEATKVFLKNLINRSAGKPKAFQRNILKEYLQILVLDFLYSHSRYSQLVFYGGSCLAHCFGLPRLSEDLDFVDLKKEVEVSRLAKDLAIYFQKNTDLNLKTAVQKLRIYLKFPLLYELGLAKKPEESNWLFLKIEIFKEFDFCQAYETEIIPLFKFNKSILIKTFDLSTLMATKIRAIFYRKWQRIDKKGRVLVRVKGRDYFDLLWYWQKGIVPNLNCLEEISSKKDLKEKLLAIVEKIDFQSIRLDLEPLVENQNFVKNLSRNMKAIFKRELNKNNG